MKVGEITMRFENLSDESGNPIVIDLDVPLTQERIDYLKGLGERARESGKRLSDLMKATEDYYVNK